MAQQYSFCLPYESFDLELGGLRQEEIGTPAFQEKVSHFFTKQFSAFRGKARVICDDKSRTIRVTWSKDSGFVEPLEQAMELLGKGKVRDAIPILWTADQQDANQPAVLYNLGVAYNEVGEHQHAISTLQRLLKLAPDHLNGLIALGVARIRMGHLEQAAKALEQALEIEPDNVYALRNLAACRLKQGRTEDAVSLMERAFRRAPSDIQILVSYGTALEEAGRTKEADDQYVRAIAVGGSDQWVELAKQKRSAIAQKVLRDRGGELRPDVLMYLSGALEKFEGMTKDQIQQLGVEIAMLGQRGLDINNPEKKYPLKSLPGKYSGLHMVSMMYAAFQEIAPGTDVGIDFSREYQAAKAMRNNR
jgi:Flp pilus assembly protein TadD